jgi:serine/threonine-protein kinase HipA
VQFRPRILSTFIDEQSGDASIELELSIAEYFRLTQSQARQTAGEVAKVLSRWKQEAIAMEILAAKTEIVSSVFEHEDMARARKLTISNRKIL